MAYSVYLDKILCPIAPSKLQLKIKNQNKTLILMNEGEVNILKTAGLTDISFDLLIPNVKYPFAKYDSGFKRAKYFLDKFEKMKTSKKPFQFIMVRQLPNGKGLFNTNIKVSMEDYQIKEDSKEGFDVTVTNSIGILEQRLVISSLRKQNQLFRRKRKGKQQIPLHLHQTNHTQWSKVTACGILQRSFMEMVQNILSFTMLTRTKSRIQT